MLAYLVGWRVWYAGVAGVSGVSGVLVGNKLKGIALRSVPSGDVCQGK
jgi:hypothetical protein